MSELADAFPLIASCPSVYNAALIPLKLTARDNASEWLDSKCRKQRMKQTVLNQQMLNPAKEQQTKTRE